MNIHKGASGGSIPGRTPLYSCHIPFFFWGGDESVSTSSSVIPIIPRVSVSSVYLYGPFQQAHPQVSSPFPKDQKREWSHPPVRGSVVSSSFPGTPARTGYTFLHVRSNCPHNIHRRCTFFSMFPTSLSRMALMLCCG